MYTYSGCFRGKVIDSIGVVVLLKYAIFMELLHICSFFFRQDMNKTCEDINEILTEIRYELAEIESVSR